MAGNKLARFRGSLARAKSKALSVGKSEKVGSLGHEVIKFGSHAGLALLSKNFDSLGPVPVKPDMAGLLAGFGAMMFGKGKLRKLGRSVATGAAHAVITRMVAQDKITFISGADIPAPKAKVVDAEE